MVRSLSTRSRIAALIRFARRFWIGIILIGLPLGLFLQQKYVTMRSDGILTRADSIIVSVRRDLHSARQTLKAESSDSDGERYDYYKLSGTEKSEFLAQFRQRTFGLSGRTYAGIYPFWLYTLDGKGFCSGRILVQGAENGRREQWEALYDAAVKGERVNAESKAPETPNSVQLVRQIMN